MFEARYATPKQLPDHASRFYGLRGFGDSGIPSAAAFAAQPLMLVKTGASVGYDSPIAIFPWNKNEYSADFIPFGWGGFPNAVFFDGVWQKLTDFLAKYKPQVVFADSAAETAFSAVACANGMQWNKGMASCYCPSGKVLALSPFGVPIPGGCQTIGAIVREPTTGTSCKIGNKIGQNAPPGFVLCEPVTAQPPSTTPPTQQLPPSTPGCASGWTWDMNLMQCIPPAAVTPAGGGVPADEPPPRPTPNGGTWTPPYEMPPAVSTGLPTWGWVAIGAAAVGALAYIAFGGKPSRRSEPANVDV